MGVYDLEQTWSSVCLYLKEDTSINNSHIDAFFSRIHPQVISSDFLMLTTETAFIKQWVETHYSEYLKKAMKKITGEDFTILIEVDTTNSSIEPKPVSKDSNNDKSNYNYDNIKIKDDVLLREKKSNEENLNLKEQAVKPEKLENISVKHVDKFITPNPINNQKSKERNNTYTFENFVVGSSNDIAYTTALSVAEQPGKNILNPLFIHGRSGLGKTHLLRAIQSYIDVNFHHLISYYTDSNALLREYTDAALSHSKEKSSYNNFAKKFDNVDVLLIDDIQYLQGKTQTLDMVFQIFNTLIAKGKQVVLAADRAPKNIDIDERYQSRFNSGGTFEVQPPEIETKLGIIKLFLNEYNRDNNSSVFIPDDVQIYIAENSSSNIRELKSAITNIIYHLPQITGTYISVVEVEELLRNHFSSGVTRRLTVKDIQTAVSSFYKISVSDIVSKSRVKQTAFARHVAIYLSREIINLPQSTIGHEFNRDHSTVNYSLSCIEDKIKEDRQIREELEAIRMIIKNTEF